MGTLGKFGKVIYRVKIHYQRDMSEDSIPERYQDCDDLWSVTCYFNPCHYRNRLANYRIFTDKMAQSGLKLLTVECAFGNDPFELPTSSDILRVRSPDILWQKERLLNLAIQRLPPQAHKVAWLDCDVLFSNPGWAVQTARLLDNFPVVQPFEQCVYLYPTGVETNEKWSPTFQSFAYMHQYDCNPGFCEGYFRPSATGFAWAARRELLDRHGLYDGCLSPIADHLMTHAMVGDFEGPCFKNEMSIPYVSHSNLTKLLSFVQMHFGGILPHHLVRAIKHNRSTVVSNDAMLSHFLRWGRLFYEDVQGRLGYTPGTIMHLWHGALRERKYLKGQYFLIKMGFNPETDVRIGTEGCWEWACECPVLKQWAKDYFYGRKEDG
jgi:hypothetical protein